MTISLHLGSSCRPSYVKAIPRDSQVAHTLAPIMIGICMTIKYDNKTVRSIMYVFCFVFHFWGCHNILHMWHQMPHISFYFCPGSGYQSFCSDCPRQCNQFPCMGASQGHHPMLFRGLGRVTIFLCMSPGMTFVSIPNNVTLTLFETKFINKVPCK